MNYRPFGSTGIKVSEIGVGCGGLGGERKLGLEPALDRAIELGVNFFDTCDTYAESRSEQTLGRVFARVPRDKIVVCTKFGGAFDANGDWYRDISVKHLHEAFAASCKRLGTDYFDIYLVHTPPKDIVKEHDLFAALEKMVEQGKIRAYGLSLETGDFAIDFVNATGGRGIEILFNLFAQDPRRAFLKVAREKGVGIICKTPLGGGTFSQAFVPDNPPADDRRLKGWGPQRYQRRAEAFKKVRSVLTRGGRTPAQGALAWLLSFPEVSTVIPGISSLARVEETAGAAGMRLTAAELAELDAVDGGALVGTKVD